MTDSMTERYPVLARVAPAERPEIYRRAEAGLPLTADQRAQLGLGHSTALLPADGCFTSRQLEATFSTDSARRDLSQMLQARGRAKAGAVAALAGLVVTHG